MRKCGKIEHPQMRISQSSWFVFRGKTTIFPRAADLKATDTDISAFSLTFPCEPAGPIYDVQIGRNVKRKAGRRQMVGFRRATTREVCIRCAPQSMSTRGAYTCQLQRPGWESSPGRSRIVPSRRQREALEIWTGLPKVQGGVRTAGEGMCGSGEKRPAPSSSEVFILAIRSF